MKKGIFCEIRSETIIYIFLKETSYLLVEMLSILYTVSVIIFLLTRHGFNFSDTLINVLHSRFTVTDKRDIYSVYLKYFRKSTRSFLTLDIFN